MTLSAQLTFIDGHAHLKTALNGGSIFRTHTTTLDYIGTQETTIDAGRKVDALSDPPTALLLRGPSTEHPNSP